MDDRRAERKRGRSRIRITLQASQEDSGRGSECSGGNTEKKHAEGGQAGRRPRATEINGGTEICSIIGRHRFSLGSAWTNYVTRPRGAGFSYVLVGETKR